MVSEQCTFLLVGTKAELPPIPESGEDTGQDIDPADKNPESENYSLEKYSYMSKEARLTQNEA